MAKDYHQKVVNEQTGKLVFGKSSSCKDASEQAYYPKLKDLSKLIKKLFSYSDSEVRRLFSSAPIVCYRSTRKIKDYLIRSKLYPIERKVGSSRCGNLRCQVCTSIQVTDTFCSFVLYNLDNFKINHNFNCDSKCLIYLLSCKTCGKQCTGKTIITKRILEKQVVVT